MSALRCRAKSQPTCEVSLGAQVFQALIPRNVRLAEAPSFGKPIIFYDIHSKGAEGYTQLAQEVIINDEKRAGKGLGRSSVSRNRRFLPYPACRKSAVSNHLDWSSRAPARDSAVPAARSKSTRISIDPSPFQPRTRFREEALDELARSIKASGIIQPLVVRSLGSRFN